MEVLCYKREKDVPEDLPKMTKLMVDGKALYIPVSYTHLLVHIFCDKSLSIMIDLGIISGTA